MSLITMVTLYHGDLSGEGTIQTKDTLAAYFGSEVRGVQASAIVPPFGPYAGTAMYQELGLASNSPQWIR